MSKPQDGKGRETPTHPGAKLDRAGRILERFRRKEPQGTELGQGYGMPPPIVARSENQSAWAGGSSCRRVAATLCIIVESLREAVDAHRRYQELRLKGVPHDTAIRQALGSPRTRP